MYQKHDHDHIYHISNYKKIISCLVIIKKYNYFGAIIKV